MKKKLIYFEATHTSEYFVTTTSILRKHYNVKRAKYHRQNRIAEYQRTEHRKA